MSASRPFDTIVAVDWSARSSPSPLSPTADAIWIARATAAELRCDYFPTRHAATEHLETLMADELAAGRRVLAGFDFPFGFPRGFAERVAGREDALALWAELARRVEDAADNANNRWAVAEALNGLFPGVGPFWGRPAAAPAPSVPARDERQGHGLPERRRVEERVRRAQPGWKLAYAGAVGSQALLGLPRLEALRQRFGPRLTVWPFEPATGEVVLAEIYPSLMAEAVRAELARRGDAVRDAVQVELTARALMGLQEAGELEAALAAGADAGAEGWILGAGVEERLRRAAARATPALRDDCLALPAGVEWTPVEVAAARLRESLACVTGAERAPVASAGGRILAADAVARRSNPPAANAAVDGYGFALASLGAAPRLPLVEGRAAAGAPFPSPVPPGHAVRILTGALLPEGVDTVVLQEDVRLDDGCVTFGAGLKPGANTRKAGEDVGAGDVALPAGRRLTPGDLALLTAVGLAEVELRRPLRVGVLSTGDELAEPGAEAAPSATFDANRPMLLDLVRRWGHVPVDLGAVADRREALQDRLDRGANEADAILTSGGASAGDEDHVSALLRERGQLQTWRIAMKPGRPLALARWRDRPVFGLPGNPVAALVCALLFARPALSVLAGGGWCAPFAVQVPAAFEKRKKAGRREYLRARLDAEGRAEAFRSEGSGRISGLSWAEGLVELDDGARHVRPGDPVRYLPFSGFGF